MTILTDEQAAQICDFIVNPESFCANQPCTPSDEVPDGIACRYKQEKLLALLNPVAPEPDAIELVRKVREGHHSKINKFFVFHLPDIRAAALIESYGAKVRQEDADKLRVFAMTNTLGLSIGTIDQLCAAIMAQK